MHLARGALAIVLLMLLPAAARAVAPSPAALDGSISLPHGSPVRIQSADRQARLAAAAPWRGFQARHGDWRAAWNEVTGSPHRAYGRPIPLPGYADREEAVDRSLRAFVHGNPEVFGPAPDLELLSARRSGGTWIVRYRQLMNGLPVLFSDWDFRVGPSGRLFSFGADIQRPGLALEPARRIAAPVAREAAKQGLSFEAAVDRAEAARQLYLLPYPTEDGLEHRVVYQVEVRTADPPGNWLAYVDAGSGEVLWRRNRVRFDVSGTVTGLVHPLLPTDPVVSRPFPHLEVVVGGTPVLGDAAGLYSGAGPDPASVQARLRGAYCDVNRSDGGIEGLLSISVPNPSVLDIAWGTSVAALDAERDGYYHVNVAHDYVKTLEPGLATLDYVMPCNISVPGSCNAFWDGTGVNFYAAGGACPNMATLPDVVYHEYGHGVNDRVYDAYGGFGMGNGALHEGMADVLAAFMRDDPVIGRGFNGPGTSLRTIDNSLRWPEDGSGDPHHTGLIIGGAFWDLREAVGLPIAAQLSHDAKHRLPDDVDDGIAMYEYFLATLEADDDDTDLSNGTPHSADIITAFNAHGIGTGFAIFIDHAPLADQPSGAAVPVTAVIQYTGPIAAIDPGSPQLHYALNDGPFTAVPMPPTGKSDEYGATISAPGASVVHYYLSAGDTYGQTANHPARAPSSRHSVVFGPAATLLSDEMEGLTGWIGSAPGDNAVTGLWLRADPYGTFVGSVAVQPEEDHTPDPGVKCWVTGNGAPGGAPGAEDVDGGRTTLLSPVFDATAPGSVYPMIEYRRWYSNNAGATPGTDFWRVDITNNGGLKWVPVENTSATDNTWRRVVFRVEDHVVPTNNMRMRFIAADEDQGSLVEAAVDDFRLFAFPATLVGVEPRAESVAFALAPARPNPFSGRTTLRFSLPAAGPASVRVFDLGGRSVRTLVRGTLAAGPHTLEWDGRDDAGQRLPSGAYFVRLGQGGREAVRAVVRVE